MFGRTAKWLRLLGYDTLYYTSISDDQFLEIAKNKNRILLTKDEELVERAKNKKIPVLFLKGNYVKNLAYLSKKYEIDLIIDPKTSRCPTCNYEIVSVTKSEIEDMVPQSTFDLFNEFWICTNDSCKKVYYKGHHWINFEKTLEKIKKIKKSLG
ncbi:MAG: Mut7-C RNAse domain-containing protein [Candidatus Helarchaeota archaeon]|nr:Mut7-C RNAse domain-containing protein [Candidatus Helarchaeota archaeon]